MHLVQKEEGLPFGSSPRWFEMQGLSPEQAFERYWRLVGEVQARNMEERLLMDEAERRARSPWSTEDTPRDQQTVR